MYSINSIMASHNTTDLVISDRYQHWVETHSVPHRMTMCHGQAHDRINVSDYDNTILVDSHKNSRPDIVIDVVKPINTKILAAIGTQMRFINILYPPLSVFFKDYNTITFFRSLHTHAKFILERKKLYEKCQITEQVYHECKRGMYNIFLNSNGEVDTDKMIDHVCKYVRKYKFTVFFDGYYITAASLMKNDLRFNDNFVSNLLSLLAIGGSFEHDFCMIFRHNDISDEDQLEVMRFAMGESVEYFHVSKCGNTHRFTKIKEHICGSPC